MADMPTIACVVEGDGEEDAVPLLVRLIIEDLQPTPYVRAYLARRMSRSKLVQAGGLEATIEQVARELDRPGAIFVLIDADDDCPATLGPLLLRRAKETRGDLPIAVVLAKKEYEAWFLASAESLRGRRNLPIDLQAPPDPETIRDAKGWLGKRMPPGRKYSERLDQPALTAALNMRLARAADSFDKCYREIARLAAALTTPDPSLL